MIRPTLTEISKASEARHDIIHGILLSMPGTAQSTQMARFLRRKRSSHKIFSVSTSELLVHTEAARHLGTYVVNFVNALGEFLTVPRKVCN